VTSCPHCSRASDRLAPLLTLRLAEIDRVLGLPAHSLQEARLGRLREILTRERELTRAIEPFGLCWGERDGEEVLCVDHLSDDDYREAARLYDAERGRLIEEARLLIEQTLGLRTPDGTGSDGQ
jgi:hypothetical protein